MTALAMIIGMLPMAFALGEGGEQNAPLGRAVIGGLAVATIATLFFVPTVFSLLHRDRSSQSGTSRVPRTGRACDSETTSHDPRAKAQPGRGHAPSKSTAAAAQSARDCGSSRGAVRSRSPSPGILERRTMSRGGAMDRDAAVPTVATSRRSGRDASDCAARHRQAWYEAPIYARVNGYLKKWNFDYGAHVKKGDVLAEIETPDLDAQLAAAQGQAQFGRAVVKVREAEEKFADTTYQRWRDSPKGVVSVQEQETKKADYNSAEGALNASNWPRLTSTAGQVDRLKRWRLQEITAPFDGVVTARETDVGALINAGSGTGGGSGPELFRVADIHKMRVYVQVPQQMSADISGADAELTLPQYPDKTFKAMVATTSRPSTRRADSAGRAARRQRRRAAARRLCAGRFRAGR